MSPRPEPGQSDHRCWGCGVAEEPALTYGDEVTQPAHPIACGQLCTDCSWEEHLAGMAHTGEYDAPRDGTPACCRETLAKTGTGARS